LEGLRLENSSSHNIRIDKRNYMEINGVKEVISFDETSVILLTNCGELEINGNNLHVSTLDTDKGIVILDGKIDSLFYSADKPNDKKGIIGRLFS
jgi:sporulation protein YabP